jgi:hypothetical protein
MCTHLCIPEFLQPWSAADPLSWMQTAQNRPAWYQSHHPCFWATNSRAAMSGKNTHVNQFGLIEERTLRSRWTIRFEWMWSTARSICFTIWLALSSE